MTPVTKIEVKELIVNLPSGKAAGYDEVSNEMLKVLADVISDPLSILINKCLSKGVFPDCLKVAQVVPLYKDEDDSKAENYRPISLLPSISKIFEKIIYKKLSTYFESFDLLYSHQFGFRNKLSTVDAIVEIVEKLRVSFSNNFCICTFLDLKKPSIQLIMKS